jgi:membrane protein
LATRDSLVKKVGTARDVMSAFRLALSGFFAHQGFFLSAGLAFYFLICVIPLLFLVVSLAGFVLSRETATAQVIAQLGQIVPVYQQEITRALLRIVATRKLSGILGTVILLLFSTQLFAAIRLVLNRILGVPGRGFLHGMGVDIGMILLIGPLFLAALGVTDLFVWFKAAVFHPIRVPRPAVELMGIGLGLLFSIVMFFVMYRLLPSASVSVMEALGGAILTAVLWEVAKQLFRLYITQVGVYDQIYGPLGTLVAFVMFIYYSACVFVLGGEYVLALRRRSPLKGGGTA